MLKVMTVLGTRPEGIKMAPVIQALNQSTQFESVFVNTAQHREMLDQVLELFHIVPDYDLNIMQNGQSLEQLTSRIFLGLSPIIEQEKPDLVLVHGDTTTTFIGAYASFLKQVPVAHVEAGLRTNNMKSPFPEEGNRQLVGRIADYHFSATAANRENLLQENVQNEKIAVVGNTVIDALLTVANKPYTFPEHLEPIFQSGKKTILLTTHRRENLEELQHVYKAINRLVTENDDIQIVFPVHKNPVIRKKVTETIEDTSRVHLIEPLDYENFVHVMKHSYLVITDSGGIQEEAPALGKPVLVARNTTERPEGVEAGTLKLVGTSEDMIYKEASQLLNDPQAYHEMSQIKNPFGNGESAQAILQQIQEWKAPALNSKQKSESIT
ncbi:UDP-N-acetylglucosamine 2-epimerase (non-hydrolysing) [Sinobaca qinghaiensis]|uniref:UDP-N-acetylglucosamine 2-epimerase (non-hydrolyzing) n=1 Tax=Sinobaca qinghaiensis TaxID=342944 RepID=A0A419V5B8_9BACL|nr:UDP-N-acetylglucosamine 2-epimerase (non-hydrolyzing) [Sinobaca qinghaiensis]RKD73622.1 UDP-N-acetylglucosamine 2-epimerase (non-hydrolysing) [Sinobaca qinghaiensis]